MLKNYIKIALRNLARYKTFSFINIFGLAIGMACAILIMLWVQNELSFDRFNKNAERTYRVNRYFYNGDGSVSLRLRAVAPTIEPLLENDYPEIEYSARIRNNSQLVNYGDKNFEENAFYFAEPEIFNILTIDVIKGDPETALTKPFNTFITEETAERYFGSENPIGKILSFESNGEQKSLMVKGVIRSLPHTSSWRPDFIISFATYEALAGPEEMNDWSSNNYRTYILLKEKDDYKNFTAKLDDFINRHLGENSTEWTKLELQNILDVHFDGDYSSVYIISGLSLFILLIAGINFMNLATARSIRRTKEVGIRKTIGGKRGQLIKQFLAESVLLSFIALIFAYFLVELMLPSFNKLIYRQLDFNIFENFYLIPELLVIVLFIGIGSGLYPAVYLSSFNPVSILKNSFEKKAGSYAFRNILVVFQFSISIFLIICVGIINNQLDFMNERDLGYDKNHIVTMSSSRNINEHLESFKSRLLAHSNISNVTVAKRVPSGYLSDYNGARIIKDDSSEPLSFNISYLHVDHDYINTFDIKIIAGRDFSRDNPTDNTEAFILNECAVKKIGWKSPRDAIGKQFGYGDRNGKIIGIVKDFHFESLHNEISPIIMMLNRENRWTIAAKIQPQDMAATLDFIKGVWTEYTPKRTFDYSFIEDRLNNRYVIDTITQKVFNFTAIIAVLIACLGLFGLAAFTVEQRTKEIGIRKVLGASETAIVFMLTNKFSKWVLIANIFAVPLAYFAMKKWLENYAYRIEIGAEIFIISGLIALLVAVLTVSFQATKAALANPVDSLRNE